MTFQLKRFTLAFPAWQNIHLHWWRYDRYTHVTISTNHLFWFYKISSHTNFFISIFHPGPLLFYCRYFVKPCYQRFHRNPRYFVFYVTLPPHPYDQLATHPSTLLYHVSLLSGCWDDHHRNPNINTEVIWLGDEQHSRSSVVFILQIDNFVSSRSNSLSLYCFFATLLTLMINCQPTWSSIVFILPIAIIAILFTLMVLFFATLQEHSEGESLDEGGIAPWLRNFQEGASPPLFFCHLPGGSPSPLWSIVHRAPSIVPIFPHSSPNTFSSYCRRHWHAIVQVMMIDWQYCHQINCWLSTFAESAFWWRWNKLFLGCSSSKNLLRGKRSLIQELEIILLPIYTPHSLKDWF